MLQEKKLVGKSRQMSFAQHQPFELWRSFMPRRKEITNAVGAELYSAEVYNASFFDAYHPEKEFRKWALVEVSDFNEVPEGMETIIFPAGLYAVFLYKGLQSEAAKFYEYIFRTWLPASNYVLDHRPHFAVMGDKYKREDPASEEEIWIPVKEK